MTANTLKFIACIFMLIDHVGVHLFPHTLWLRFIGRLAMPIFAFFIGEGCRHTSHKLRYFVRVFILGVICQIVVTAVEIFTNSFDSVYLNILLTFSLSIAVCFAYLRFEESVKSRNRNRIMLNTIIFILVIFATVMFDLFCTYSKSLVGVKVTLDYGLFGALLPLASALFADKSKKIPAFTCGMLIFAAKMSMSAWYSIFSLLSLPLLAAYNGKRGNSRFKYGFYVFYPAHIVVIYVVKLLFF